MSKRAEWLWLLLALAGPALLYGLTLAPSIVSGDSAEFQTEAWRLGVTHPTGYPLYLLLGRAFALLPAGDAAFRLNLFSLACALVALRFLFEILAQFSGKPALATAGVWLAAVGPAFWSQAVVAEVYALHAALTLAALLCLLRWGQTRQPRWLLLAALAFGLGAAHHRMIVLLVPAAALYVLLQGRPRPGFQTWLKALGLFILPLALYIYVPLRWPVVYGRWPRGQELVDYLLGRGYSYALQPALLLNPARWQMVWNLMRAQLPWAGLILAALGVVSLSIDRSRWRELGLLGAALLTFLLFGVCYAVPDVAVFFIPAWLLLALLAVLGLDALADRLARWGAATHVPALIGFALALLLAMTHFEAQDRSDDLAARAFADRVLAHPPEPNALIVCDFERLSALRYAFAVEAAPLNVEPNMPDTEAMAYTLIDMALVAGRPVYLARPLPGAHERYRLNAHGPLIRLLRESQRELPPGGEVEPRDLVWGYGNAPMVALRGIDMPARTVKRTETLALTLYWQALFDRPHIPQPYQVRLQLVDGQGNVVDQNTASHPVDGFYPLNGWQNGEVVADYRLFTVDPSVPPGLYQLQATWVLPFSPGEWLEPKEATIATVEVLPNPDWRAQPQKKLAVRYANGLRLIGFDLKGRPVPGRKLQITLYLHAEQPIHDVRAILEWDLEGHGRVTTGARLDNWPAGETFSARIDLPVVESAAGSSQIKLSVMGGDNQPVSSGGLRRQQTVQQLARINLEAPPPTEGAPYYKSFDDKLMLLSYQFTETVSPGGVARVTLHWWAMSPMREDYTVFVQLLDDERRVRWQQDIMPAFGARPTSGWQPGEVIQDIHEIPLPADAPPGVYRVEIGVYSPITWQRLHVLDQDGLPQADYVPLPPITIK